MKILFLILSLLFFSSAFAEKTSFSKEEIILPLGKNRIKNFLLLMKDPANRKLVKMEEGLITFQDIPADNSVMLNVGSISYLLYWDDFDNDKKSEYMLVYLGSGSGRYSGVLEVFSKDGKNVVPMKFSSVVVSSLFPGKDMSRFHGYLANPFAVRVDGKTYLRFQDTPNDKKISTYKWEAGNFAKTVLN